MMVSELTGQVLDYWVARAIGVIVRPGLPRAMSYDVPFDIGPPDSDHGDHFEPSARWGHGGPLIKEYNIELQKDAAGWMANEWPGDPEDAGNDLWFGPTPLIAAMRALVASRFGEDVSDDPTP